jgi:hypothetical protein
MASELSLSVLPSPNRRLSGAVAGATRLRGGTSGACFRKDAYGPILWNAVSDSDDDGLSKARYSKGVISILGETEVNEKFERQWYPTNKEKSNMKSEKKDFCSETQ